MWHFDEPLNCYTVSYWGDSVIENTIKCYDASAYGNDGIFKGDEIFSTEVINIEEIKPFMLNQNFPNPFSKRTVIRFSLPFSDFVSLTVYNLDGNEIEVLTNNYYTAGTYEIDWHACDISNGMYVCKLTSRGFSASFKMILEQ
jgi:hypothetical protein